MIKIRLIFNIVKDKGGLKFEIFYFQNSRTDIIFDWHPMDYKQFFVPKLSRGFFIRLLSVTIAAYLFFGFLCIPIVIDGRSMEPTYHDGGFNFCWRPAYWFSEPQRGDVVGVRFAGRRVMLLKRIVALSGEQVEFRDGVLHRNGEPQREIYIQGPSDWNLPPRVVNERAVYVVGDNRATAMHGHSFGQVDKNRIVGKILW